MKVLLFSAVFVTAGFLSFRANAQHTGAGTSDANHRTSSLNKTEPANLFIDVHHLGAGNVSAKDAAAAHQKDLAVGNKYGVNFMKFWVDEANGDVYCLSSAPDSGAIRRAHAEAHGLLPDEVYFITEGQQAKIKGNDELYLDLHELGAGNVSAKDVEGAHQKDLAVQQKYGVNLIDYWVDEKKGTVMCLAQAPDSTALINTHKEAHGLVPVKVVKVKQGE